MAADYLDIKNQLSTMLGADGVADLPPVDQARIGIYVNQAYRECYTPIDGRRPQWATKQFTLTFAKGVQSRPLGPEVIDVDKIPELVGVGPLSPMAGPEDELRQRAHHSADFKAPGYKGLGFPTFHMEDKENGTPLWYYVDTSDSGTDTAVDPRLFVYPIPDKEYTVNIRANIIPSELSADTDEPRLPGEVVWDILFPIAQEKLLSDPRYNGQNKELLVRAAESARRRLSTLASAQKQRGSLRMVKRGGW
ncbi:MAG: hypothetical protein CL532_01705 [Aestuariivita sp.]|nr:hypothetical protein [Aestuariivita sp.]|tara:strand:+ start:2814 stop:3563 length:750 start_codon:yes stop_codon:yes gene_type:complete